LELLFQTGYLLIIRYGILPASFIPGKANQDEKVDEGDSEGKLMQEIVR